MRIARSCSSRRPSAHWCVVARSLLPFAARSFSGVGPPGVAVPGDATAGGRQLPPNVQTGASLAQSTQSSQRSSQNTSPHESDGSQQAGSKAATSSTQPHDVARTDSGNDFAMSIADGVATPGGHHHTHQQQPSSTPHSQQPTQPQTPNHNNAAAAASDSAAAVAAAQHNNQLLPSPSGSQSVGSTGDGSGGGGSNGSAAVAYPSPTPQAPKIETVPTAFKWIHGGSEVYVTGSFNNWQGKILMYPNEDGQRQWKQTAAD